MEQTTRPTLEGLTHGKEYTVEVWAVNAQGAGPSATTTATPPSPDTPGRVELTSRRPRVGVPLTATLVDPDAPVRVRRWQWLQSPWYYRSAGDSSLVAPSEERYPELASYEPTVPALGRRLRAVVDYTDQYGPQSAQSAWTAPVLPGRPEAPALSATAGDGQVALTWTAAADQGAAIVRYQYHRSDKPSGWLDVPGDGLDGHYTVGGLTNDADYTFKVRAVNSVGEGSPSNAVTATPQGPADPNPHAPAIAGPEEVSVAEGHIGALADADYTTSDDDGDAVTLTLTDADRGPFSLSSSGTLQVTSALDYESDDTRYEVTLTATDDGEPSKSSTKQVTVTVDNVDEVGTVTLSSSSPQVGDHLTATLSDPDGGIRNVSWSWQDIPRSDESDDAEPPQTTSYPYTVEASDEGRRIEVRASYTDAHGSGKTARATTEVVQEAAESNRHEPAIAGPEEVWVAEGHTGALADADYTTSDGDGDEVTLTLTDAARGPFSLSSSGTLHVTSALDYESDDTRYEVTLTATDDGEPSKSSTKQVTVTVTNQEEEGTVRLSSSQPQVGVPITARLSDPDGQVEHVRWSWLYFSSGDGSRNGEPTVVASSDELIPSPVLVGLRLQARALYDDGQGPNQSAESVQTEPVQEAAESNRYEPAIAGPEEVWVAEGHTGALADADYTTSDDDGDAVTLTLTDAARGPFSLSSSGTLHVTSALDYESDRTSYEVTLTATDDGTPSKSSTKRVEVTVDNVDEAGTVSLTSSSPQVGDRLTASLSDPDGYQSGGEWDWQLWYRQGDGDDASWVRDESVRYTADSYTVQESDAGRRLRAVISNYTDGHGSGKSAHSALTEPVEESNRHTPVIEGPSSASMDEGDTGTLGTYTTSDGDGDRVTLTLTNADRGPFSLSSSGALRLTSALDYERDDTSYTVTLTATDDGTPSKSSTKSVSVSIRNVEEAGTVSLTSSSPQVGDRLTASLSDPDGYQSGGEWDWQLWYRQGDGDDASWVRDESVRYTADSYTVQASDAGRRLRAVISNYTDGHGSGKSAHSALTEPVEESNRHEPVISGSGSVSINEGATGSLADYTTSDGDGDDVTLTLTNADRGPFSLSSSGALRVTSALDYERDDTSYTVTLTATDDGTPSKSSTKSVSVSIRNVEEAGTVSLTSSSPRVGDRLTASLSDPDGYQSGGEWDWQLWNRQGDGDDASWVRDESVRYTADSYTVQASDAGRRLRAVISNYTDGHGSGKTAHSALTAVVQESNRHEPVISGSGSVSINEGATGSLANYTTSDGDGDDVTLTLTNADGGPFSLSSSGALRVTSALDYERDDTSYTVTLTATDDGTPSKSSTKRVEVTVDNVDEQGTVSLTSSSPRVGDRLTASLSDPDGYQSGGSWQWLQFRGGRDGDDDSWEEDESVRYAADSYTVPSSAVGRRLRARISGYTDGHGSGKSAQSSLTATVRANEPGSPGNFTAEPGNIYTRVDLSWSAAAANGSAITRYEYRYKAPSGSWSSWTSVGVAYSTTVSGLSSGQRYSFEVRAVNGEGAGPSSSTSSLVRTPPAKPVSLQALPDTVLSAVAAPNPFNPTTTIHMQVPMRGVVWLTIYNIAGQVVRTLLDDYELDAGYHSVDWDGRDQQGQPVTSGVYLYHLRAGTQAIVHKLLLIR